MDTNSLIVHAISAGLVNEAVEAKTKSLLNRLIVEIKNQVTNNNDALSALVSIEKNPTSLARQALLREELDNLNLKNAILLEELASEILEQSEKVTTQTKYNINISSGSGIVIGDANNISQSIISK